MRPEIVLLTLVLLAMPLITRAERPDLAGACRKHVDGAIRDRRWFHENAELALREFRTQAWMRETLSSIPGVEIVPGQWGTGVVALLRGEKPGPIVAWRTDMDGLPITEATGLPFASANTDTISGGASSGVMHACGHDLHMAIAIGIVRVLSDLRAQMPGSLLFIGEPAEEIGAGAPQLLEAGLFEDGRRPMAALALHVHPTIPTGKVGSCSGPATANVDAFGLTVKGVGGHGAYPHEAVDPISLAARIVLGFESIVSREIDPNRRAVISVGRIQGGTKSSVIPDEVLIEATVRSHDEETRQALKQKIERLVLSQARAAGAPEPELAYYLGTPAGRNDPDLVEACREVFRRVLGKENEITYEPAMGGEDFSYYGKEVPAFQFRLGVGRPDREMALHRSDFDPDERAIGIGLRVATEIIWDRLAAGAAGRATDSRDGERK